jgi:hypothetical protein
MSGNKQGEMDITGDLESLVGEVLPGRRLAEGLRREGCAPESRTNTYNSGEVWLEQSSGRNWDMGGSQGGVF